MPRTVKGRHERTLAAEANTSFRESHAPLLLTVLITLLSFLSAIHAPRVHAHETIRFNEAWFPIADGSAQPTAAWSEFCDRRPAECVVSPSESARIELNGRLWDSIVAINKKVNAAVAPQEDIHHWGVIDRWDYPDDGYGDCEDYQILKRRLLVEAGLSRRALRMVVVLDELGQGHAVLAARTDQGDFILDNRRDAVLPWHQTGYIYIKSEGDKDLTWVWLRHQAAVTSAIRQ